VTSTLAIYGHLFPGTDRLDGLLEDAFANAVTDFPRPGAPRNAKQRRPKPPLICAHTGGR